MADTYEPWAVLADLGDLPDGVSEELAETALQVASDVLFQFTRRRYPGYRQETLRPGRSGRPGAVEVSSRLHLPFPPIVSVDAVTIGSESLPSDEWQLLDSVLIRMADTEGRPRRWPTLQRLDLPLGTPDTWSVTYTHGRRPPPGGVQAAAALARQLATAWSYDQNTAAGCRLPRRVTTISRQGVTLAVLDPFTLFADGLTGLSEVDLWVSSERFGDRTRRAGVIDIAGVAAPRWHQVHRHGQRSHRDSPPGS